MIDIDFKFYLSIFWRRLPLFLLVWVAIAGIGISIAYTLPPIYRSTATILAESPRITLVEDTVNLSSTEVIQTIEQRLMTRANLLDIADRFDIFPPERGMSPTDKFNAMTNSTIFEVLSLGTENRRGRGDSSATVFTISFVNGDPAMAARVNNELVTLILEQNVRLRTTRAAENSQFFEQEVKRLSNELAEIEARIVEFKNRNTDALPESLTFRRQEMSRIQTRLMQLDNQEVTLLDQREQLRRSIENPAAAPSSFERTMTREERDMADLKRQLAQKRAIFADTHPQVVALMSEIAVLQDFMDQAAAPVEGADGEMVVALTPAQLELQQVESNITFIEDQRRALEEQLEDLAVSVEETPNVEMSLNVLVREHAVLQTQYESVLARLNTAAAGEAVEARQKGERFEVIEQANTPDAPESPNRPLIAAGGVAGGMFVALALLVLLELLNRSIRRPADIINRIGIQPFATIPYIATRGEILRARLKMAGGLAVVAIGIPAVLYLIHYQYMPIDLILDQIAERFGMDKIFS